MRRMQAPGMAYEDEAACLFMSPDATVPLPLDLGANFISGWVCGKHDGSGSIADSSGSSSDGSDGGDSSGSSGGGGAVGEISPMASLISLPNVRALKGLLLRGAPHVFPWQVSRPRGTAPARAPSVTPRRAAPHRTAHRFPPPPAPLPTAARTASHHRRRRP